MRKANHDHTTPAPPVISGATAIALAAGGREMSAMSRRQALFSTAALGGAIALSTAATAATLGDPNAAQIQSNSRNAAWRSAMDTFEARRAKEDAYDQAVWMPAYHASNGGGPPIPERIDAKMEKLMDARSDAELALIFTAAPDLSAVIWKMECANKRWEGFCGWPDDWWNAVINDIRRFAGGAA